MVEGAARGDPSAAGAEPELPAGEERHQALALLEAERSRNDQLELRLLELQSAQQQLESYAADLQQTSAELRRHLSHMTVLHEVSRAISSALDPDEVMSRALDALADLIPYQAVAVYLLDEQDLQAKRTAGRGEVDPPPPPYVGVDDGVIGRALRDGALAAEQATFSQGEEPLQTLAIPLRAHGRTLGAIYLARPGSKEFRQEELQLAELLAAGTAVAMQNALLYRATQWLATIDPLTEVPNYRYFREALALEVERARRLNYPLGLLMIDLDRFKRINDVFGHPTGDQVLVNVARTMYAQLRRTDVIARIGGEEFAVILPGCSLAAVEAVGEKMRRAVGSIPPLQTRGRRKMVITLSAGGTWLAPDEVDPEALIRQADQALYLAKQRGRNQVRLWSRDVAETGGGSKVARRSRSLAMKPAASS